MRLRKNIYQQSQREGRSITDSLRESLLQLRQSRKLRRHQSAGLTAQARRRESISIMLYVGNGGVRWIAGAPLDGYDRTT